MSDLARGQRLHRRFTLRRRLGSGGMAAVWLVQDDELGEQVAAKIVPAGAAEPLVAGLQRECRVARRLSHPNIVPVFEFHRGDRYHLTTMAYVEGNDLRALRGASVERVMSILVGVADALDHAHQRGVVHRDLKATNVILDSEDRPHLLDFGIGGVLDGDEGESISGGGSGYNASPQQLDGDPPQPSDDLYAFGVLLYELISGAPPFWPDVTSARVREESPPAIPSRHGAPPAVQQLVSGLLAKSGNARPANMGEVRSTLTRLLEESEASSAVRLTPPPRAQRSGRSPHPRPRRGRRPRASTGVDSRSWLSRRRRWSRSCSSSSCCCPNGETPAERRRTP